MCVVGAEMARLAGEDNHSDTDMFTLILITVCPIAAPACEKAFPFALHAWDKVMGSLHASHM